MKDDNSPLWQQVKHNLNNSINWYVNWTLKVYEKEINKDNYQQLATTVLKSNGYSDKPVPDWLYLGVMNELKTRIIGERLVK